MLYSHQHQTCNLFTTHAAAFLPMLKAFRDTLHKSTLQQRKCKSQLNSIGGFTFPPLERVSFICNGRELNRLSAAAVGKQINPPVERRRAQSARRPVGRTRLAFSQAQSMCGRPRVP